VGECGHATFGFNKIMDDTPGCGGYAFVGILRIGKETTAGFVG
jgi:hypothetical protein